MNRQIMYPNAFLPFTFGPSEAVRREEAALFVVRILAKAGKVQLLTTTEAHAVLSDIGDKNVIRVPTYVATAIKYHLMVPNEDRNFEPQAPLIRAQLAVVLFRAHAL
jgi:hypothetical protein